MEVKNKVGQNAKRIEHGVVRFIKDWTLPVSIAVGSTCYLLFYYVPSLDEAGNALAPVFDVIFPLFVFLTLLITFCKVDYHQLLPHRWHTGVLLAQLLLVALTIGVIFWVRPASRWSRCRSLCKRWNTTRRTNRTACWHCC